VISTFWSTWITVEFDGHARPLVDLQALLNVEIDVATERCCVRIFASACSLNPYRCERRSVKAPRYFARDDRIQKETAVARDAFRDHPKLQVWVLYHLQSWTRLA
jgi:hypothetical protein